MLVIGLSVAMVSCGSYNNGSQPQPTSKLKLRALVSNSLHVVSNGNVPAIEIVDALKDQLSFTPFGVGSLPDVGAMDLSINKKLTLVYSPGSNAFGLIDNTTEQSVLTTASLPDATDSFFLAIDNKHAYAAVPNAPVSGQQPGAVYQIDMSTGNFSAILPVPHARYLSRGPFDGLILAFGDDSHVTVITANNIGTGTDPRVTVDGFDHPVAAAFSADGKTAYVLECGAECGGVSAAVTVLDLTTNLRGTSVAVPGATVASLQNPSTLYVAGTPPETACDSSTLATTCGTLSILDLSTLTVTNPTPIIITDGRHDRIVRTPDGQLFIGAKGCTSIKVPASGSTPGEIRGCLTIVKGSSAKVPPDNGDVTGIAAIPGRNVVYVIEDRELRIYDTTTDALLVNHQINVVGQLVDVKVIDDAQ